MLVCKQVTSRFWKGVLLRSRDFIAICFKANSSKGYAVPRFGCYLKDEGGLSLLWISQALLRVLSALRLSDKLFSERPKILVLYFASMMSVPRIILC